MRGAPRKAPSHRIFPRGTGKSPNESEDRNEETIAQPPAGRHYGADHHAHHRFRRQSPQVIFLSVLSPEVIRGRICSLTMLLSTQPSLEILALDSRESFQRNKEYYLRRLEEETEPAVRELLERDMAHLDAIQFSSASSRKFVLVLPLDEKAGADEGALRQLEKAICDHGLRVRLAEEQDVKRLLAIYYRQDLTTEVFRDFDGEEYMAHG